MVIFGKIIGALLGALIAGPVGLMIGLLVGHYFDRGLKLNLYGRAPSPIAENVFFKTTFMIMGHIAKADGRISEKEIEMARNVMNHLQLSEEQKSQAIHYFNMGKAPNFNTDAILDNFVRNCGQHPQLMQMFIEIQLQAGFVDGLHNVRKRHALEHLCDKLSIPRSVLSDIESQFYAEQPYSERAYTEQPRPRYSARDELASAYSLIGVTVSATDAEVKKAYRLLMSQNHPDKLVAKGLPEPMIKLATEKTQKIQKAYEVICNSRGI